ncbi:MAG: hypothetical protein WCY82_04235 [Desulfotomaculaceae bacterium]
MADLTNKVIIASLGVFIGLVLFGVSVSLTHFNRLVDPQHPLHLLEWQLEKEQPGIRLLGENLHFRVDREQTGQLAQQLGEKAKPVMYEINGWTAVVKQEISTNNWLEKAVNAAQEARHITLETLNQFKKWLRH